MSDKVSGLVLNEDGYKTYPAAIFAAIREEVQSLNWRITNVRCCGPLDYVFPFENAVSCFVDGESLYQMLSGHPDVQWIWGILSGIPKSVPEEEVKKNPIIDVEMDTDYLDSPLHHIDPDAVLEIVAFDSSETYVLADNEAVIHKLKKAFPKAESLVKYENFDL